MLSALASGTLARDPRSGTSASGTRWANSTIRVSTGQDKEGAALTSFISVVCFGDVAEQLGRMGKGDSISVQGPMKQTQYEKDGETRHGLEILANGILNPYQIKKRRGDTTDQGRQRQQPQGDGRNVESFYQAARDYNDDPGF